MAEDYEARYKIGVRLFNDREYDEAIELFGALLGEIPQFENVWLILGLCYEGKGDVRGAIDVYERAMKEDLLGLMQKPFRQLCRTYYNDFKASHGVDRLLMLKGKIEENCDESVRLFPEDLTTRQIYSLYLVDGIRYQEALFHLNEALRIDPNSSTFRFMLSSVYSRAGLQYYDLAIEEIEKSIALEPGILNYHSLAVTASISTFQNPIVMPAYLSAIKYVEKNTITDFCPKGFQVVLGWGEFLDGTLSQDQYQLEITVLEEGENVEFGPPHPKIFGNPEVDDLVDTNFKPHDIILIHMKEIYVTGNTGIFWRPCTAFTGSHRHLSRIFDQWHPKVERIQYIQTPTVVFLQLNQRNYYHFIAETLSRVAVALEYMGDIPNLKFLFPKLQKTWIEDACELMDIDPDRIILYDSQSIDGILLKNGYFIDWHWKPENDIQPKDVLRFYYPAKSALFKLRDRIFANLPTPKETGKILYVSRADAGVRKLDSEDELDIIKLIVKHSLDTKKIQIVVGSTMSIKEQIMAFRTASVIIGPHGAGLVNMMWSDPGATVIAFPMKPNTDNTFGYISSATGHEYWLVPEIGTFYHDNFAKFSGNELEIVEQIFSQVFGHKTCEGEVCS